MTPSEGTRRGRPRAAEEGDMAGDEGRSERGLSRREFGAGLAGLGVAALMARPATGQTPARGGRLRVAMAGSSPNDTLDPHKAVTALDASRCQQLYSRLVYLEPTLKPGGELAESFEPNRSGDEWVFKLRRGITFHDGRPLTVKDVIYSFERLRAKETASPAKVLFDQIAADGLRADGDHTLRVKLTASNADFAALLTGYHACVVPDGTTDFGKGIGTGPFKLKTFRPGVGSVFERNPSYWRSGRPYVDEVEIFGIADAVARTNALMAGEVHLVEKLDPAAVARVKATPSLRVLAARSGFHGTFHMQTDQPPFDNPDVRLALKHLIDRERFVEIVFKGYAQVGNDHPVPPNDPYYCRELPLRAYDPDRAKALLKKAGHENLTLELHASTILPGMMEGALVFKEHAAKAGVTINIVRQPSDGYWSNVWLKKPFAVGGWTMRPVPDIILSQAYVSTAKWNETHWKRPAFDKLVDDARATTDQAERYRLYCQAQRMIHEDGGVIVPAFSDVLDAGLARVQGFQLHPVGTLGHWRYEGLWLSA
jgi:peptide/nickel transport system substrate-binding protein